MAKRGRPKNSKAEAEQRRRKVREMSSSGFNNNEIADILGVHRNTVTSDLKRIEEENRSYVSNTDKFKEIGETLSRYKTIEEYALREHQFADKDDIKTKIECLKLAANMRNERVKLAIATGLIPKIDLGSSEEVNLVDKIQGMTVEELKKKEQELIGSYSFESPKEVKTSPAYQEKWEKKQLEMEEGIPEEFLEKVPEEEDIEETKRIFSKEEMESFLGKQYNDEVDSTDNTK